MSRLFVVICLTNLISPVCWLNSYGRGAGDPISDCKPDQDKDGALCYPKCQSGYVGVGPVCWQTCPGGFEDHGAFCAKPKPYGRGAGYVLWDRSKCERSSPTGQCEKNGLLWYPTCKPGFHNVGCCICSPNCIEGQTDIGISCAKKSYGRGAGEPLRCSSNKQLDGALCYMNCKAGFDGVGPVCWNTCPAGLQKCGLLCVESSTLCTQQVLTMTSTIVVLVGSAVLIPFSGGASAAIAAAVVAAGSAGGAGAAFNQDICPATIPNPVSPQDLNTSTPVAPVSACSWEKIPGSAFQVSVLDKYSSHVVNNGDGIFQYNGSNWNHLDGAAKDVGVGANGKVWVIGTNVEGGGYGIYRRDGSTWTKIPGSAVRIDVAPDGNAWVVNKDDRIYKYNGSNWEEMSGRAKDIGIGADGSVWVIGTNAEAGGYGIYKFVAPNSWTKIPGSALRIDVGPNGNPWVVNNGDNIYQYNGSSWNLIDGKAKDVGIGKDGSVWVIGTNTEAGGYGIYRRGC
jgi:hypothetical protein